MALQAAHKVGSGMRFEVFEYELAPAPPDVSWEAFESASGTPSMVRSTGPGNGNVGEREEDEARQAMRADELRRSFEAGRERGFGEGRAAEHQAISSALHTKQAASAEQIARAVEAFHGERARYFEAIEPEVVKLALAVAARILRREAHADPLLLSGAIRVALGQLSAATQVRLLVPPADLELWADAVAHMPNLAPRPAVAAGKAMQLGECMLETELGSVDLALDAQLAEIEQGFLDGASAPPPVSRVHEEMAE